MRYGAICKHKDKTICRRYVLNLNLVDVLRRTPDEFIHCLEASCGTHLYSRVVCFIPDITTRDREAWAAVLLADGKDEKKWYDRMRTALLTSERDGRQA